MPISKTGNTPTPTPAPVPAAPPAPATQAGSTPTAPSSPQAPAPTAGPQTFAPPAEEASKRRDLAMTESLNRTRVNAAETKAGAEVRQLTEDAGYKALPESGQKAILHELQHPEARAQLLRLQQSQTYLSKTPQERAQMLQQFAQADGPARAELVDSAAARVAFDHPMSGLPKPSPTVFVNGRDAFRKDETHEKCD